MSEFENVSVSNDKFEHVKKVLFGRQKQANVTNEAVAFIVSRYILKYGTKASIESEAAVTMSIKGCLEDLVNGNTSYTSQDAEDFVRLIAGEKSFNTISIIGPKLVNVWQPNPESPKVRFSVVPLGDEPETGDATMMQRTDTPMLTEQHSGMEWGDSPADTGIDRNVDKTDIVSTTEKLKDKILATAPTSVVTEFSGNEYAAALYMYDTYKKVNS